MHVRFSAPPPGSPSVTTHHQILDSLLPQCLVLPSSSHRKQNESSREAFSSEIEKYFRFQTASKSTEAQIDSSRERQIGNNKAVEFSTDPPAWCERYWGDLNAPRRSRRAINHVGCDQPVRHTAHAQGGRLRNPYIAAPEEHGALPEWRMCEDFILGIQHCLPLEVG